MASNWSSKDLFLSEAEPNATIFKALALSLVTILALVGNFLVIAAVWRNMRMRTVTNFLIVNLAVAEFLYIPVAMPPFYFEIFNFVNWPLGNYGFGMFCCKFLNFGQYMLLAASVFTLAVIAADRFFAIMVPLRRMFTKRVFCVSLCLVWFLAVCVAAPVLYSFRIIAYGDILSCEEHWTPAFDTEEASKVYTVILFVSVYCVPFSAMTIIYCIICRQLWIRKAPGEGVYRSGQKVLESRKKVVKMILTVVVAFIICWLPVQIASFVSYFEDVEISSPVWFLCMFVMRAHPALNPCIYAAFSANYRTEFEKSLTWCCSGVVGRRSRLVKANAVRLNKTGCSEAFNGKRARLDSISINTKKNSSLPIVKIAPPVEIVTTV